MDENSVKDPAINWYFSNYYSSTRLMSQAERGAYVDVLAWMFEHGHLEHADVVKACEGCIYPKVFAKLTIDENGLYFNRRLDKEIAKRQKNFEARVKNLGGYIKEPPLKGKGKKKEYPEKASETPVDEASTQNAEDIPKTKTRKPVILKPPTLEAVEKYFTDHEFPLSLAKRAWEGYQENNWIDSQGNEIKNWKLKMVQVWFKDEHKNKTGIGEHGQHPGQNFVSGEVAASYKK